MAISERYFGLESLNLNASQRNQLVAALQALGTANDDPQPSRRNHRRVRSDQLAVIFQASFDDDTISIAACKQRLATIFSVSVASITHTVATPTFAVRESTVVTFTRTGTDYIRAAIFGGLGATLEQSRVEVLAYIAANAAAWAAE
jgi:hypothetical protein